MWQPCGALVAGKVNSGSIPSQVNAGKWASLEKLATFVLFE